MTMMRDHGTGVVEPRRFTPPRGKKFNDDRGDCTSNARNFTLKRFGEVRRESEVPDNVSLSGQ